MVSGSIRNEIKLMSIYGVLQMAVSAFGTFQSLNKKVFRTEAYLQWGNSEELIGLVIMLNPGSSRLASDREWDTFNSACEVGKNLSITGQLKMDNTMEALVDIFSKINPDLNGKLEIYNLFNYRCGNSDEAINSYQSLISEEEYSSFLHSTSPNIALYPWVWVAWSEKDAAILNNRKNEILRKIPEDKLIALPSRQKQHQSRKVFYCYHPYPLKLDTRDWVHSEIVKKLENFYTIS
jgi:hypothetical protein